MNTPLRQVLVHLDSSKSSSLRLQAAREIAEHHGAALAALYAVSPCIADMPFAGDMTGAAAENLMSIDNERRDAARATFERDLKSPGPVPGWSETSDIPIMGAFLQQALYADLMVLGQRDAADGYATALPPDFNESVIIASGKPALIIPYIGGFKAVGETVLIAWKETRESARAVSAALPLLQSARRVHVVGWDIPEPPRIEGPRLDLDKYLRLHGVEAQWHREGDEPASLGEMLLSRAFDLEANLLVMGCYGHSRARELVLGGASRTVLRSMTMPVLMAH